MTVRGDPSANQKISDVLRRVFGFGVLRYHSYQSIRFRELRIHGTSDGYSHRLYSPLSPHGNTSG
jgi:hypothetical protein